MITLHSGKYLVLLESHQNCCGSLEGRAGNRTPFSTCVVSDNSTLTDSNDPDACELTRLCGGRLRPPELSRVSQHALPVNTLHGDRLRIFFD